MRIRIPSVAGLRAALFLCTAGWAATPDDAEPAAGQRPVLEDALRVALQCELDGNDVDRNALLQHVLEQDPEFAPARWHLGELKVNDAEWVPVRRFVDDEDERWHQLYLYRKERDERGDTINDHFHLANAAHQHELWDEERAHLMRIVELDRDNAEARARLGDVRIDGFRVAREEVEEFARSLMRTRRDLDAWSPEVNRIVGRLARSRGAAREAAWAQLTAIRNPAAIPAVEHALASGDERVAVSYLDWLRGLEAWEASVALARQAVFSPSAAVRSRAQQFLQDRRIDDYVPVLLGAMREDTRFQSRLFVNRFGGLVYTERIAYETQNEVRVRNLAVLYGPENPAFGTTAPIMDSAYPLSTVSPRPHSADIDGRPFYHKVFGVSGPVFDSAAPLARIPGGREAAVAHLRQYYQAFSPSQGRIGELTVVVGNDRASRALAAAMQIPERESPREWWDWWIEYQQVYVSGSKPRVDESYEEIWAFDRKQFRRTPRRVQSGIYTFWGSCFAAGTTVVTEYGPKPIEEIVLGDRVLAQDVDTGRIAFKPVFKTTVRPPVQLLRVTTEEGELVCTGGHPFWINGLGWRYAWELEPGMRFHSVDGSSEVISVEDSGRDEEAYNFVVADFHNYFVGDGRILCHDNSPRNPTNVLVPGLMPDWSAPVEETD